MTYVALLRGINVGGNSIIKMSELKTTFKRLGLAEVKTYINSGNVMFQSDSKDLSALGKQIEAGIQDGFSLTVKVMLRDHTNIKEIVDGVPDSWVNDQSMKCDVMFLDPSIDKPSIVDALPINHDVEDVRYIAGTIVRRIDRDKINKSKMTKLVGTDVYKQMTARNTNTVRKLYSLMSDMGG